MNRKTFMQWIGIKVKEWLLCWPLLVPHISGIDCPVFWKELHIEKQLFWLENLFQFKLTVVVVRISWQGCALSVSTLFDGALVSKESKSKRKSQTAKKGIFV